MASFVKKCLLGTLMILLCLTTYVFAEESLLQAVKANESLFINGETFICSAMGKSYLVSIGVSEIKGASKKQIVNAIKSAKLGAKRGLTKFIHDTSVSSNEKLIEERTVLTEFKDGERVSLEVKYLSQYEEIISEKARGTLRNVVDVGKWKGESNEDYYYALAVEL